jgi:hypothetical protein
MKKQERHRAHRFVGHPLVHVAILHVATIWITLVATSP